MSISGRYTASINFQMFQNICLKINRQGIINPIVTCIFPEALIRKQRSMKCKVLHKVRIVANESISGNPKKTMFANSEFIS